MVLLWIAVGFIGLVLGIVFLDCVIRWREVRELKQQIRDLQNAYRDVLAHVEAMNMTLTNPAQKKSSRTMWS